MTNTIKIPSTIKGMTTRLGMIESLLTARGWERAAVCAAFVRLGEKQGQRTDLETSSTSEQGSMSVTEFTGLGIQGLESRTTVTTYVQHWLIANEGVYPEPGQEVILPEESWPPSSPEPEADLDDTEIPDDGDEIDLGTSGSDVSQVERMALDLRAIQISNPAPDDALTSAYERLASVAKVIAKSASSGREPVFIHDDIAWLTDMGIQA